MMMVVMGADVLWLWAHAEWLAVQIFCSGCNMKTARNCLLYGIIRETNAQNIYGICFILQRNNDVHMCKEFLLQEPAQPL